MFEPRRLVKGLFPRNGRAQARRRKEGGHVPPLACSLAQLGSAGAGPQDTRDRLQPPGCTPARSEGLVVEGGGDSAQGCTLLAQPLDFRQDLLLGRFRLHVLAVLRQPVAERDVPDALALAAVITAYLPEIGEWQSDFRTRRRQ